MQGCDLAHNPPKTLKRLAHALHLEPGIPDLVWHQKPLGRQSLEHQALKRPLPQFSALTPSHALCGWEPRSQKLSGVHHCSELVHLSALHRSGDCMSFKKLAV